MLIVSVQHLCESYCTVQINLNNVELLDQCDMSNSLSCRRKLYHFIWCRIIGKLEEGGIVASVTEQLRSFTTSCHKFGEYLSWQEQLSEGLVVFDNEQPRQRTTGILSYRREETNVRRREKSQNTCNELMDVRYCVLPWPTLFPKNGIIARWPVRCVTLTPAHRIHCFLWCRKHKNWTDQQFGGMLFPDKSRFNLTSDSGSIDM